MHTARCAGWCPRIRSRGDQPPGAAGGFTKPCNTTGTATNAGYPEHAFSFDVAQQAAARLRAAFAAATGARPATYPGGLVEPGLTRRDDLAGLDLARVPVPFIECANMRQPEDAAAVADPEWRRRAAQGITDGVLGYLHSR